MTRMTSRQDSLSTKDIEKGLEDEEEETEDEKRKREEDELKKKKEHQEFVELIHVFICFGIIMGMAVIVVVLDNVLFPDTHVITFHPLKQQVTNKHCSRNYIFPG